MAWEKKKMRKSNCKHCSNGIRFEEVKGKIKIIPCYICDIDCEDVSEGCQKGYCNYYDRKKESEVTE